MYSDLLEASSKDNTYLFNDQSSSYDMAEVNEISSQTNLDYIFDSYYSSVSHYNTDFDLPEDCKNMSFSELFDQELFSTHENKDCKITIKIEKEEPLNPCFSADDSQDTSVNHSSEKILGNISSTSSKSFPPKRGINRTFIKSTENCDVERLIHNPFYEPENLDNQLTVKVRKPIIKCEPVDLNDTIEQNVVKLEVKPCYSTNDSQTTIDSNCLRKIEGNIQSASSKSNTQMHSAINNFSIKTTENADIKYHIGKCKTNNDQIPVKIETPSIKQKPVDVIMPSITSDSQNLVDNQSLVKFKGNIKSKKFSPKHSVNNKTSTKANKNCDGEKLMSKNIPETKNVVPEKMSVKIKTSIIKRKSEEVNDILIKKAPYSIDSQSKVDSLSLVKFKDNIGSSLSKSSTPKLPVVNKTSLKTTKNCDIKNLMSINLFETKNLGLDQMPIKIKTPIVKCEPEDINDIIEQDIEMEMKQCFPFDDSLNETGSQITNKNDISSLLSKSFNSKRQTLITSENRNVKHHSSLCDPDSLVNDQKLVKVKTPVIQCEPKDFNDTVDQKIVGMDIQIKEENIVIEEKSKFNGSDVGCTNLNNIKIENQEISIIKNEEIEAENCTIRNGINLETEKKKISWEEYKAKVGKMGILKISEDNDEPATDIATANNKKVESIIEEFDRNTAEHFIGQKRKIEEDEGQQIAIAEEKNSIEDQELQNKRMKIEYIKRLHPSSFASEIAKTSSLMKGNYVDDIENESTSDDSMSNDKIQGKNSDTYENLRHLKKDDKSLKKFHQTRVSYRNSSRPDYVKSSRLSSSSSSSNPDDYYNRNRIDAQQNGQYNQSTRNIVQRSRDQKRVVYVGQIPIKFGKRYLYNRFKTFGSIISLTLHKKPDFRVYYAFVTYSEKSEAEHAINHGNDDDTQVQLDIRFGERKQTQTPYYDLDDEWLTDWYGYNQPIPVVRAPSPEKTSFEEELQEFYKLAQIKKSNQIKPSQVS